MTCKSIHEHQHKIMNSCTAALQFFLGNQILQFFWGNQVCKSTAKFLIDSGIDQI